MPANLPPEYKEAEGRYRKASAAQDKIEALKEMLSLVPKHKGTEKLRVDLKKRLNKLEQQREKEKKKKRSGRAHPWEHIEREGAGQVVLVGLPNSGKSTLLDTVTNARPQIAEFPFSTFEPTIGMMPYEDIQIQLIDLPPLSEFTEGWTFNLIRQADVVALFVDLSADDPASAGLEALGILEEAKIQLVGPVHPEANGSGSPIRKKTLIIAAKADAPNDASGLRSLHEAYGEEFPIVAISARSGQGLDEMRCALFELLGVVRVYSKKPGHPPSKDEPFILRKGSTVLDAAKAIHKELAEKLDFARIWGSVQYEGQRVERDHIVQDGDIIEIHA